MDQGKLRRIVTPSQNFSDSPSDKFLLSLMCTQAKLENDNKREAVMRGIRAKVQAGWFPAFAPLGYLNDPYQPKGMRKILRDPERAPLVRQLFDLILQGVSPSEVRRRANEEWGLRMRTGSLVAHSIFYRILANPFYCGEFEYPAGSGHWFRGAHEPLISRAEHERVQVLLGQRGCTRGSAGHEFAYTGLIRCGTCGSSVTAEEKVKCQHNGNVHRYTYYHCNRYRRRDCPEPFVEVRRLEEQLREHLAALRIPQEFYEWGLEKLNQELGRSADQQAAELVALRRAVEGNRRKRERLLDLRLADEVAEEEFRERSAALDRERLGIQDQLRRREQTDAAWRQTARDALTFAHDALDVFDRGDAQRRRQIVTALVSNLSLQGKILSIDAKKPLHVLLGLSPGVEVAPCSFEPPNLRSKKKRTEAILASVPFW